MIVDYSIQKSPKNSPKWARWYVQVTWSYGLLVIRCFPSRREASAWFSAQIGRPKDKPV